MNTDQRIKALLHEVKKLQNLYPNWERERRRLEKLGKLADKAVWDFLKETDKIVAKFPEWQEVYDTDWELITSELEDISNDLDNQLRILYEREEVIGALRSEINDELHNH